MVNRILRWFLFGGILFFLAKTLKDHWQEVRTLEITGATLALLTVALGITLIAHIWSGWVWHLILKSIGQPRDGRWTTMIYLKTNIAKYLPGNVWHFYGRVRELQTSGSSTGAAILGVVLEPVLMAAAALGLAAISFSVTAVNDWRLLIVSTAALVAMLVAIHPRFLNPILQKLGKAKAKSQGLTVIISTLRLKRYPWSSLLGELGFVILRGIGFVITIAALQTLQPNQILPIMGAFSIAWLLGLVVPGAPGGVGVFEAVAIAILGNQLPSGLVISGVALYRLISTLAEALGAGLIWLEERIAEMMAPVAKFRKRLLLLPPARNDISAEEETAALLETAPQATPEVSYVVTPKEQNSPQAASSQAITMYGEDSVTDDLDNDLLSGELNDAAVEDMTPGVKLDKSEPALPSFLPQSVKAEGEPTSQSFSPRKSS
ncbi:integral membrane protein [Leptolyngbya sp. Heron Island J]|uniref:lysylphosphatidylglycerol synthase transmembrane domain-containing protein n=1 Tax=Leptolyngbya sp. Heron Island J TaxID=1385935 RepID=UPI0003B9A24E|nr:YbhN family protein [Leptolyngbya sp. Heron Island J]ESA36151.1 integral membrane protein [Leptolyngbya sp. Heron Island J]